MCVSVVRFFGLLCACAALSTGCADGDGGHMTRDEMFACQRAGSECPSPNDILDDVYCCPISTTLPEDGFRFERGGARVGSPSDDSRPEFQTRCTNTKLEAGTREEYSLRRNVLGCMVWERSVDNIENNDAPDTSNYTLDQMLQCQTMVRNGSEKTCPSPVLEGVNCCRVIRRGSCSCVSEGGISDPTGNIFNHTECHGGVCDAEITDIEHYRDSLGCVAATYSSGASCFSDGF